MQRLLILIFLALLITACADEQLIDEQPLPPTSNVDVVIAPIVDDPLQLDAKEALRAIFDNPPEEYSVAYSLTQTANGQTQRSSENLFIKGENTRTDHEGSVDGTSYETREIVIGDDRFITCAKQAGWECYALPLPPNATMEKPSFDELWGDKDVQFSPDRLVVGTVTNCFIFAIIIPGEGTLTSEACYTDDGIPLYFEMKGSQGTIVQQAVSYGTAVPDSAFEPPVKPGTQEEFFALMNKTME